MRSISSTAEYQASLRNLRLALDSEINRVDDIRDEYARYPQGTIAILTVIAPALQAAKTARAAGDVEAMREAYDALAVIE